MYFAGLNGALRRADRPGQVQARIAHQELPQPVCGAHDADGRSGAGQDSAINADTQQQGGQEDERRQHFLVQCAKPLEPWCLQRRGNGGRGNPDKQCYQPKRTARKSPRQAGKGCRQRHGQQGGGQQLDPVIGRQAVLTQQEQAALEQL